MNFDADYRFQPGTRLNDELMNFLCGVVLQAEYPNILFLSSNFMSDIIKLNVTLPPGEECYDAGKVQRWIEEQKLPGNKRSIFDFEKILVPVNANSKHWIFIVVDMQSQLIKLYDGPTLLDAEITLNNDVDDEDNDYLYYMREFLCDASRNGSIRSWQLLNCSQDVPLQRDSTSCGLFVMFGMILVSEGLILKPTSFTQDLIDAYYCKVAYGLFKGWISRMDCGESQTSYEDTLMTASADPTSTTSAGVPSLYSPEEFAEEDFEVTHHGDTPMTAFGAAAEVVTPTTTLNAFAKDAHQSNSRTSTATNSNWSGPAFNTRASTSKKEAIDPLSVTIEGIAKGSSNIIAYAVNKTTMNTEELICGSCKDLLSRPMRVSCCEGVYCFDCLPYSGSRCPGCREDYHEICYCREIGDKIKLLNIHCPGNCGWFGTMKDHKLHWSQLCYQADVERIAANKVQRFIRTEVDRQIQQITEQGKQLQLKEPLDIKKAVASKVFREQCKSIEHIILEMDRVATTAERVDEEIRKEQEQVRLQRSNAATRTIQNDAKGLEELSNSISTKTFGGGVHQSKFEALYS